MEKGKYAPCWCLVILGVLIIVWTWWWTPGWANWAITIAAALVIVSTLVGKCTRNDSMCCEKGEQKESTSDSDQGEGEKK